VSAAGVVAVCVGAAAGVGVAVGFLMRPAAPDVARPGSAGLAADRLRAEAPTRVAPPSPEAPSDALEARAAAAAHRADAAEQEAAGARARADEAEARAAEAQTRAAAAEALQRAAELALRRAETELRTERSRPVEPVGVDRARAEQERDQLREALAVARARAEQLDRERTELRDALEATSARVERLSALQQLPPAAARAPLTVRLEAEGPALAPGMRDGRARVVVVMAPGSPWSLHARRVRVTLDFRLDAAGISLNGQRSGPLILADGALLSPERPLELPLVVTTGPARGPGAARPGDHEVQVTVQFEVEPVGGRLGTATAPLSLTVARA
jgi:hypothetical protein